MSINGKAYIAGAFEHPTRLAPDKSVAQLHAEAARGAIADAGLHKNDIDGYFCAGDAPGLGGARAMVDYMGLKVRHIDSTETGGSSYLIHVAHAAQAIAAGKCNVALITLAGRPRSEGSSGTQPRNYRTPPRPTSPSSGRTAGTTVNMYAWRDAPHARVRHHQRAARLDQGGRVAPRAAQPARDAARGGDGGGRGQLADDRRPAAPAGLLRRQRRWRRADRHPPRDRPP
jgi:acetyl-CoA acetyltransferase